MLLVKINKAFLLYKKLFVKSFKKGTDSFETVHFLPGPNSETYM